jgi:hypothetical protein
MVARGVEGGSGWRRRGGAGVAAGEEPPASADGGAALDEPPLVAAPEVTGPQAEEVSLEPIVVSDGDGVLSSESGVAVSVEDHAASAGSETIGRTSATESTASTDGAGVAGLEPVADGAQRFVVSVDGECP